MEAAPSSNHQQDTIFQEDTAEGKSVQRKMNQYHVDQVIKRRRQEGMAMALRVVQVNRGTPYPCTQARLEKT